MSALNLDIVLLMIVIIRKLSAIKIQQMLDLLITSAALAAEFGLGTTDTRLFTLGFLIEE
jgi:hypothetical protein